MAVPGREGMLTDWLVELLAPQGHVSVGDGAKRLHLETAIQDIVEQWLGAVRRLPVNVVNHVDQRYSNALFAVLPVLVYVFQNPLRGTEARSATFFQAFLLPVLATINRTPRLLRNRCQLIAGHFRIEHAYTIPMVHIQVAQDDVRTLGGRCEFVITRNRQPYCVVERKRASDGPAAFAHGRAQAFVYAAAIGHTIRRQIRAIVTNLRSWQFVRVNGTNHRQSEVFTVN